MIVTTSDESILSRLDLSIIQLQRTETSHAFTMQIRPAFQVEEDGESIIQYRLTQDPPGLQFVSLEEKKLNGREE